MNIHEYVEKQIQNYHENVVVPLSEFMGSGEITTPAKIEKDINAYGNLNLLELKDEVKQRMTCLITASKKDGTITISNIQEGFMQYTVADDLILNGQYRLSGCPINQSNAYFNVSLKDASDKLQWLAVEKGSGVIFDCHNDRVRIEILCNVTSSTPKDTLIFTPKLELLQLTDGTMTNVALTEKIQQIGDTEKLDPVKIKQEINAYGTENLFPLADKTVKNSAFTYTVSSEQGTVTTVRAKSNTIQCTLFQGVLDGKYLISGCAKGGQNTTYFIHIKKKVNGEWKSYAKETGAGYILEAHGEEYQMEILDFTSEAKTLVYHPKMVVLELPDGTLSNVGLSQKLGGDFDTDKISVVKERTIYDVNHLVINEPQYCQVENGIYTRIAHKDTNSHWCPYTIYDTDLKSSNGLAKIKVNVTEISGNWKSYFIFKDREGKTVYKSLQTISTIGEYIYDLDVNYLSVYENYKGEGVDFVIANSSHSTDDETVAITIDRYDVISEGVKVNGDTLTEVLNNLSSKENNVGSSVAKLHSPNGTSYVLQVNNDGQFVCIPQIPKNILYIGNSLLLGFGNHGMASTTVKDDYYYKVNNWLTRQGSEPTTERLMGGNFEKCTTDAEVNTWLTNTLSTYMSDERDLVIIQLGDNVNTAEKLQEFGTSCGMLCSYIREHCPKARVAWVGMWYTSDARISIVKAACYKYGCTFIDINDLSSSKIYQNELGATYIDGNGNEATIEQSGIASHPNNKGFTEIAKRIVRDLFDGEYTESTSE